MTFLLRTMLLLVGALNLACALPVHKITGAELLAAHLAAEIADVEVASSFGGSSDCVWTDAANTPDGETPVDAVKEKACSAAGGMFTAYARGQNKMNAFSAGFECCGATTQPPISPATPKPAVLKPLVTQKPVVTQRPVVTKKPVVTQKPKTAQPSKKPLRPTTPPVQPSLPSFGGDCVWKDALNTPEGVTPVDVAIEKACAKAGGMFTAYAIGKNKLHAFTAGFECCGVKIA